MRDLGGLCLLIIISWLLLFKQGKVTAAHCHLPNWDMTKMMKTLLAQNFSIYLMAPKWHPLDVSEEVCGTPFFFDSPKVLFKRIFQVRRQYKSCFYLCEQQNDMHFERPQGRPRTFEGRPSLLAAQKWHTKWFFRGVPNTKVVSIWVTKKMTYNLGVRKNVRGHLRDALFLWQPKSGIQNDFSAGTPPI